MSGLAMNHCVPYRAGLALGGWRHASTKRLFGLSTWTTTQHWTNKSFATHCMLGDIDNGFAGSCCAEGLVAFDPLFGANGPTRRNMLGMNGSRLFILTTDGNFTLTDTQKILRMAGGSIAEIQ